MSDDKLLIEVSSRSPNVAKTSYRTQSPSTGSEIVDVKPRSGQSVHKTSSTGKTIDILILPRSANNNKEKQKEDQQSDVEDKSIPINNDEQGENELIDKDVDEGNADELDLKGITGSELLDNLPNGVWACPFVEHGCHKVGNKIEVKLHGRDDRQLHFVLLARAIIRLQKMRTETLREQSVMFDEHEKSLFAVYNAIEKYGPQFIFRISHMNEVISNAARDDDRNLLFSQPFQTHRFGYKMAVIVAPCGDAEAHREYLSVYVTLIKGDYDAILRWPFTFPITFTAIAAEPRNNLIRTFTPNPIPENDVFLERPITRNPAFGIQRFCKLSDVDNFIIMNDFFLSVHVDLSILEMERTPRVASDSL